MFRKSVVAGLVLVSFMGTVNADEGSAGKLIRRGASRVVRGDYEGAVADLDQAIVANPSLAEAYRQRGLAHMNLKKNAEAINDFTKAIELAPDYNDVYLARAKLYYGMERYSAAIADFDKVIEFEPTSLTAWNWRGAALELSGDLVAAAESFEHVLKIDPTFANAWMHKGDVERGLGKINAALESYRRAIELDPTDANAFNSRAVARQLQGDFEGALADLDEATRLAPTMAAPYATRFCSYTYMNRPDDARKNAIKYLVQVPDAEGQLKSYAEVLIPIYQKYPNPKTSDAFVLRGAALASVGYRRQAITDLRKAVELDEFNASAYMELGRNFVSLGYFSAAIDAYQSCIEADDRYALAYDELGDVYRVNLNQVEQSMKFYDKAVALGLPYGCVDRGLAKLSLNDPAGAIADFNRAIELNPKLSYAWTNRAATYLKMKKWDLAVRDVETAINLDTKYWHPYATRGRIKLAKKDYAGAIADLTTSMTFNRNQFNLMYRGVAYLAQGNNVEAQKDFDESLKIWPRIKSEMDSEIAEVMKTTNHQIGRR